MSMTHTCVAQLLTERFMPSEPDHKESSIERGRRAQIEAWSLRQLVSRVVGRLVARLHKPIGRREQSDLQIAVMRLSELSPHLLIDIGIDPTTRLVADEDIELTLPRPVKVEVPTIAVEATPVTRPLRAPRLLLELRIPTGAARPLGA